jgi:dTDP-glucose 4,6-dehydratase
VNLLVSGGCGFIGSNLIRLLRRERSDWRIVNLDLMTYAANPMNLASIEPGPRYRFACGDVADRSLVLSLFKAERFDGVIHCAAESHVDRSIHDSGRFLRTNIEGTLVLLEAALEMGGIRHIQMSTDEVYGTLGPNDPPFTEATPLAPRSPYSASKAAADHLVQAFHHTHGLEGIVTRCSNNYGPYQHPEKLIPLMITSALRGLPLPIYGDGRQRRDWIHVEDHCTGVLAALERGRPGEPYNFGGGAEHENLAIVREIVQQTAAKDALITFVADRPGHDRRYSVDFGKASRELGWRPSRTLDEGLRETIQWYRANEAWWAHNARSAYDESRDRIERWEQMAAPKRESPGSPATKGTP